MGSKLGLVFHRDDQNLDSESGFVLCDILEILIAKGLSLLRHCMLQVKRKCRKKDAD